MTKLVVVWMAMVIASVRPASAADKTFEKFISDLGKAPADAAKHLDGCDVLVMPNGEARRPCKISASDLAGTDKDVTLKATKVQRKTFPKSVLAYTEADVQVSVAKKLVGTYHVMELTSDPIDGGLLVQHWSKLVSDKDALAAAKAGKLATPKLTPGPTPPPAGLEGQDKSDRAQGLEQIENAVTRTDDIKSSLASDAKGGAIIVGSAPGQRYTGASGSKTLAGWKIDLKWSGKPMTGGTPLVQWAYTQAVGTLKDKTSITYGTLALQVQRMTGGGSPAPSPAMYIFSVPQ